MNSVDPADAFGFGRPDFQSGGNFLSDSYRRANELRSHNFRGSLSGRWECVLKLSASRTRCSSLMACLQWSRMENSFSTVVITGWDGKPEEVQFRRTGR